jgi:hypothetical protein
MKIVKRGLRPNERTYAARCKHCYTEVEFIGKEGTDFTIGKLFTNWKLVGCPVCERTIKTEFKNGFVPDAVSNEG